MMTFQDFLEHAEAKFRKELPDEELALSKSHIFHLGEDEKIEDGIKEIWDDLKEDMTKQVPLPFVDTSCLSVVEGKNLPGSPKGWILDRIIEAPISEEEYKQFDREGIETPGFRTEAQRMAVRRPKQKLAVLRVENFSDFITSWCIYFFGVVDGGIIISARPSDYMLGILGGRSSPAFDNFLINESRAVIKQVAAISHPANYIIQVKPDLTPREERRVQEGRERPIRKSPHFIVVDHEILVSMSHRNGNGEHASPVPHERRGHWRRLADHCRHARLLGKEKTWVRPTYVGETSFSDGKNHYDVLMDFGRKKEEAVTS